MACLRCVSERGTTACFLPPRNALLRNAAAGSGQDALLRNAAALRRLQVSLQVSVLSRDIARQHGLDAIGLVQAMHQPMLAAADNAPGRVSWLLAGCSSCCQSRCPAWQFDCGPATVPSSCTSQGTQPEQATHLAGSHGFWPGAAAAAGAASLRGRFGGRSRSLKLTSTLSLRTSSQAMGSKIMNDARSPAAGLCPGSGLVSHLSHTCVRAVHRMMLESQHTACILVVCVQTQQKLPRHGVKGHERRTRLPLACAPAPGWSIALATPAGKQMSVSFVCARVCLGDSRISLGKRPMPWSQRS